MGNNDNRNYYSGQNPYGNRNSNGSPPRRKGLLFVKIAIPVAALFALVVVGVMLLNGQSNDTETNNQDDRLLIETEDRTDSSEEAQKETRSDTPVVIYEDEDVDDGDVDDGREYDDAGRLSRERVFSENGEHVGWTVFEYVGDSEQLASRALLDMDEMLHVRYVYADNGAISHSFHVQYDKSGNRTETVRLNAAGLRVSSVSHIYDDRGVEVTRTENTYDEEGALASIINTEFYKDGEPGLTRVRSYHEVIDGSGVIREINEFSVSGNLIVRTDFGADGSGQTQNLDEHGNPVMVTAFGTDGTQISRTENVYNDAGTRLISITEFNSSNVRTRIIDSFVYDNAGQANGRRVREYSARGDLIGTRDERLNSLGVWEVVPTTNPTTNPTTDRTTAPTTGIESESFEYIPPAPVPAPTPEEVIPVGCQDPRHGEGGLAPMAGSQVFDEANRVIRETRLYFCGCAFYRFYERHPATGQITRWYDRLI